MSAKYYGTEKIGETFMFEGKKYKVVEDRDAHCDHCAFSNADTCEMQCYPSGREDGKFVKYVEVKQ
jgi:D-arabinose 1-dehydrogenase-like Zn-dependent alcohol dehydrogenase